MTPYRYSENYVTDKEFETLSPRVQEHVKRIASSNAAQQNGIYQGYFSPNTMPSRFKRVGQWPNIFSTYKLLLRNVCAPDWLRDKVYFERLSKKDPYIKNRLGFTAPNIFTVMLY